MFHVDGETLSRQALALRLRALPHGSLVLLLGEVDTGKSTLAARLVKDAAVSTVALIDTDVGQGSLAPPGSIGAVLIRHGSQPESVGMRFVGAVSPVRHIRELCEGAQQLLTTVRSADPNLIVVDTCGLVRGKVGIALKQRLARALAPDVVLAVARSGELDALIASITLLRPSSGARPAGKVHDKTAVWRLVPAGGVHRKTAAYRRRVRTERLARALSRARSVTFSIMPDSVAGVQKSIDFLRAIAARPRDFEYLLLGLENADGLCLGIGTLQTVSRDAAQIVVLTAVQDLDRVTSIRLGDLMIAPNGTTLAEIRGFPAQIPVSVAQPIRTDAR